MAMKIYATAMSIFFENKETLEIFKKIGVKQYIAPVSNGEHLFLIEEEEIEELREIIEGYMFNNEVVNDEIRELHLFLQKHSF